SKAYGDVLSSSDKLIAKHPELWWPYQFRGLAKRRGSGQDKTGALADFEAGMKVANSKSDIIGVETMSRTIAGEIGTPEARKAIAPYAVKDPRWKLLLAALTQNDGDIPGAIKLIETVMEEPALAPDLQEKSLKMVGVLYLVLQPPLTEKSIETYRKLLKLAPNDFTALNNIAGLLVEPGSSYNPLEALTYSQRAFDLTQQAGIVDPLVMDTHAWVLINNNRVDEGISLLRDAVQKKSFPEGHYHLGEAYLRKNPPQPADAERALKAAELFIEDAQRESRPVDLALKAKVEASLKKARMSKD
ncbi:MAG: hypothetical protein ACREJC_13355, partial [Tepidisphaeraceae bacterium]